MSTINAMENKIKSDINRSDLTSQISTAINRAIRYYYNSDNFYFNETTATFDTVSGQKIYENTDSGTGITDIAEILMVKIAINASTLIELTPRTFQYLEQLDVNSNPGQPFDYAYYNQNFYIYPIPDAAYTVTVYYNKEYSDLSGNNSNDFTTDAEDLIEARARWLLYMHVIRDSEAAAMSKAEEKDALQALRISTARKTSTGKVRPIKF